ncbi:MAG: FtsX-like permease family protein [Pseudomonadota bacterium]
MRQQARQPFSGLHIGSYLLSWKIALRELRGGLRGFYVFVACIALGVAAIAAVGSLTRSLNDSIANQGQVLLGGDVALSRVHQRASPEERQELKTFGATSEIATLRSMARLTDRSAQTLIEIKAVDQIYPLYGALRTDQNITLPLPVMTALVDTILLQRLGLKPGDQVRIGTGIVTLLGTLQNEPDRLSSRNVFGPRVLMSLATLDALGLIQPGSLIRWRYRIQFKDQNANLTGMTSRIENEFRSKGFLVRNRSNPASGVSQGISRLGKFLVLVGLTALLIGGVGVANSVHAFVAQKRSIIATFKCVGGTNRMIFQIYFAQVLIIALIGIAVGLFLGGVLPVLLLSFYASALPFDLVLTPQISELVAASLYGLLVAILFMLWPLMRTRDISAQNLFRDDVSGEAASITLFDLLSLFAVGLVLAVFTVLSAELPWVAFYFCAGLSALFLLFIAYGYGLKKLASYLPRYRTPSFMLARANLAGPNSLIRTIVLSLGLGLSLLVALGLIDASLRAQLESGLPQKAPDYFFIDIKQDQLESFRDKIQASAPQAKLNIAPMLRGRIVSLNGIPTEQIDAPNEAKWVLRGDRGITYDDTKPPGANLTEGAWWDENHQGDNLVSFEASSGKALGLKIGDTVSVNILGRDITAKIANFRTVKWESFAINFVMIFSPNALAGAPFNMLATLKLGENTPLSQEGQFVQNIAQGFPNITTIRVRDALEAVSGIYESILFAIRMAGSIMLIAGTLVLAGALATAHRKRIYDAAIFKTLGATRYRIVSSHMLEYGTLACATALLAIAMGSVTAWAIVTFVLDLPFHFSLAISIQTVIFTCVLVILLGAFGTWRTLSMKTASALIKH